MNYGNLGPLPTSDRNDELEELSLPAFAQLFPVQRFRVRMEPGKDRGVDRYLELKNSGFDTNFRSQVQLKTVEEPVVNGDGSISKAIKASNLNYILNGPCPLYALYLVPTGDFLYAWARDEAGILTKEKPDWRTADSVTIRFHKKLDATSLDDIEKRIMDEARLNRAIQERLLQASRSESPKLQVREDGTVIDATTAGILIEKSGATIVASGFPQRVVELSGLLTLEQLQMKRTQLVLAYAHYVMGRFDLAMGHLRACSSMDNHLTDADNWLLDELRNACEFRLGRKSQIEFQQAEEIIAQERGGIMKYYRDLDVLRFKHLSTHNQAKRSRILEQMSRNVEIIKNSSDSSPVLIMSAELIYLYSWGHNVVGAILANIGNQAVQAKTAIRGMRLASAELSSIFDSWRLWHTAAKDLLNGTAGAKNPILFADAQYTRAGVVSVFLINTLTASEIGWIVRPQWFDQLVRDSIVDAESAIEFYSRANCLESALRAKLVLADLYDVAGKPAKGIEIARPVHPVCVAMGYENLALQSADIVSGRSHLTRLRVELRQVDEMELDDAWIATTNDEAERMAHDMTGTYGLPADRWGNLLQDFLSCRRMATERRDWCRHIELEQDLRHTRDVITAYAKTPDYRCVCNLLGMHSADGPDWQNLIDKFRADYCILCQQRSPKGP